MEKQQIGRCVTGLGSFSLGLGIGAFISERYGLGSLFFAATVAFYIIGSKLIYKGAN